MTEKKLITQLGMKINAKTAESLRRMAEESGQTPTTVAKRLMLAAIKQAEEGQAEALPPYLRRFYGEPEEIDEQEE
jgi:hypothetical protein